LVIYNNMNESQTELASIEETKILDKEPLKKKKSSKRMIFFAVFFTALIFGGYKLWKYIIYAQSHIETDNAYITGHIVPVNAKIGGHVAEIMVEDNQWVKAGDILVKLEKQDLQVKINQAQATLETARQDLAAAKSAYDLQQKLSDIDIEQAKRTMIQSQSKRAQVDETERENQAGADSFKSQIASSVADVKALETQVKQNQQDYNRNLSLNQQGAVNRQTVEDSRTTLEVSQSHLISARQKIKQLQELSKVVIGRVTGVAQTKIQSTQDVNIAQGNLEKAIANASTVKLKYEQVKAQAARVKQAEEALGEISLKLSYTTIKSPVSGLVSKKNVEPGQNIGENQALLTIIPLNDRKDLWIIANLKETQLNGIKQGENVEIKVDAYPNLEVNGKVDSIGGGTGSVFSLLPPDNATGNFTKVVQRVPVKIAFAEWNDKLASMLRPGLSTTVSIETGK
jgi:membrane fusion protein (multidrug efflux system)